MVTMAEDKAQAVAEQLGQIKCLEPKLQAEIERLRHKDFVELEQVIKLHDWLEGKRRSRQSCRVVGESRVGKTVACNAYRLRHKPLQEPGKPPIVPVVYIQPPQDCTARELFRAIIEHLKYKMVKGTVGDIRSRTLQILNRCGVEMLIIDEANRLNPKTFTDVRDIFDNLGICIVLVGTDRLDAVLKERQENYNRFRACYRFGKLQGNEFKETVEIWEQDVLRLPVPSNLASKPMLKILGEATGGYIGLMDMILREAGIRALEKGLTKIDRATLEEVALEYK